MTAKKKSPEQVAHEARQSMKTTKKSHYTPRKKTTKRKKRPSSTKIVCQSKKDQPLINDEYVDAYLPKIEKVMDRIIQDGLEYVRNNDVLTLDEFYVWANIVPRTARRSFAKYQKWNDFIECVKLVIAARRERGGLEKKLDSALVRLMAPFYSQGARDIEEWRSALRKKEQENTLANTIVQVIDKTYPDNEFHEFPKEKKDE